MDVQKVGNYALGITLVLLVVAGCATPVAELTHVPPSATPEELIIIEEYCTQAIAVPVEAYIDLNENGRLDSEEAPLKGVPFWTSNWIDRRQVIDRTASDATGCGEIVVHGYCGSTIEVHAETPPGFRLTTPDSCVSWGETCAFGFSTPPTTPQSLREADLHGADLQGEDLRTADLRGADLTEANLRGADLSYADLSRADLRGADLREASLWGADLSHADLSDADLRGADMRQAVLFWADLRGAQVDDTTPLEDRWRLVWEIASQGGRGRDLSGERLSFANLSEADLYRANLQRAVLSSAHLGKADLGEADLRGTYLNNANLSGADMTDADLTGADLSEADLSRAKYDEDTRWPEDFDPVAAGAVLEE